MAVTLDQISAQILNNLKVLDPELDASVGTPARKIIDSVAYAISQAYIDNHVLSYTYDIDAKAGSDLDAFTQLFGITRLTAKKATGSVTFTRSGSASVAISIPFGTQLTSNTDPAVIFQTTSAGIIAVNQTYVEVAIQAIDGGNNGNVAAGTILGISSPITGVASVTNPLAATGGTEVESDSELRTRWKSTVFRSLAGTEAMYLGLANADPDVTSAVVLGSSKRRRERLQVLDGSTTSQVADAKYVYPTNVFFGSDIDSGTLARTGVDYTWNAETTIPPTVTGVSIDVLPGDGSGLMDLSFEYVSESSRNDPLADIPLSNKVDIWMAGKRSKPATQTVVFSDSITFNETSGDTYNRFDWVRLDGSNPINNNIFIPLSYGPILQLPETLAYGGVVYGQRGISGTGANHENIFNIVHLDTAKGYSPTSLFGIEWDTSYKPSNGNVFTVGSNKDYQYNEIPASVQVEIDRWRLAGTDALAHQAREWLLRFTFAIMYDGSQSISATNTAIDNAITKLVTTQGVGGTIQISDILQVAHNVVGVDAIRFIDGADEPSWHDNDPVTTNVGIQRLDAKNGTVIDTFVNFSTGRCQDVLLSDSTYASFETAPKVVKAQNTFGG